MNMETNKELIERKIRALKKTKQNLEYRGGSHFTISVVNREIAKLEAEIAKENDDTN